MSNVKYAKAAHLSAQASSDITPAFEYKKLIAGLPSHFDMDNWSDPLIRHVVAAGEETGREDGTVTLELVLSNGNSYTLEANTDKENVYSFVNDTTGNDVTFSELVSLLGELNISVDDIK